MKRSAKPKFSFRLWHWTCANENLFELDAEARYVFGLLVDEAFKTEVSA
jgi:hypothetical protein